MTAPHPAPLFLSALSPATPPLSHSLFLGSGEQLDVTTYTCATHIPTFVSAHRPLSSRRSQLAMCRGDVAGIPRHREIALPLARGNREGKIVVVVVVVRIRSASRIDTSIPSQSHRHSHGGITYVYRRRISATAIEHTRGRIPPRCFPTLPRRRNIALLSTHLKSPLDLVRDRLERGGIANEPARTSDVFVTELPIIGRDVPNSSASQAVSACRSSFTELLGPRDHAEPQLSLHRRRTKRRDQTANAVQAT